MLYEGGIPEPLIVKWPGVTKAGSVCREPVIGVDMYPTFLEVTGTAQPKGYELDGVSLVPLLKNAESSLDREAIFRTVNRSAITRSQERNFGRIASRFVCFGHRWASSRGDDS